MGARPQRAHAVGLSPYAFNGRYGRRYSTNDAYLEPARGRPNLTIQGDTIVDKVLFENGRAVGVSALAGGELAQYRAQTVVLSAGAVHSPAILLRSGVGRPRTCVRSASTWCPTGPPGPACRTTR